MKKILAFFLATIISNILISPPIKANENLKTTTHQSTANLQISAKPETEISTLVKDNTDFALNLYRQLSQQKGNLIFSPYSISSGIAMTYAGARGETASEIAKVLNFSLSPNSLHPSFQSLNSSLNSSLDNQQNPQININNQLWLQKNLGFSNSFITTTKNYYHAPIQELDFQNNTEQSRQQINQWVEQKTQGKIQNLIPTGLLNSQTRLVLTNAIYFKANWENPFDPQQTNNQPFTLDNGQQIQVKMMHQKSLYRTASLEELEILEIPYESTTLSIVILLPKHNHNLAEIQKKLTQENLKKWLNALSPEAEPIALTLPKFQLTSEFDLKNTLSQMGMPQTFSQKANFTGINDKQNLSLSNILHKAILEITETGTEVAVVTSINPTVRSGSQKDFIADHPFLFLLRDNNTETILFIGHLLNPLE